MTAIEITKQLKDGKLFKFDKADRLTFYLKQAGVSEAGQLYALFSKDDVLPGVFNLGLVTFYPSGITVTQAPSSRLTLQGSVLFHHIQFTQQPATLCNG